MGTRRIWRALEAPIASFTFDDFPRSALEIGGTILQEKSVHGTFYASLGLLGQNREVGDICTASDLQELVRAGHELGCHTYGHESCYKSSAVSFQGSCAENRRMAAQLLNGYVPRNFAYPYGHATLSAKLRISPAYDTCRTTRGGVNRNPFDLGFLRANGIYSWRPLDHLRELIAQNAERRSWMVFYTHDIGPSPSRYGCTEEYFRTVLSLVIDSGAEILSVREAQSRITSPQQGNTTGSIR